MPAPSTLAYDLAQTNGKVASLGGAAYYGSVLGTHLVQPIVAIWSRRLTGRATG